MPQAKMTEMNNVIDLDLSKYVSDHGHEFFAIFLEFLK